MTTEAKRWKSGEIAPALPLSFDGKGLNSPDEYKSRLATFQNDECALAGPYIVRAVNNLAPLLSVLKSVEREFGYLLPTAEHTAILTAITNAEKE